MSPQAAQASCGGADYAACLSEAEVTEMVQNLCLAEASSLSGFAEVAVAADYPQLSNTATSMIMVSAHRNPETKAGVVYSMSKGDVLECTVSTGNVLDDGFAERVSAKIADAGFALVEEGETWNGFATFTHDGGALGEITVFAPEPAFEGTTDIIVTREAAFE